jgi:hypothetical protein
MVSVPSKPLRENAGKQSAAAHLSPKHRAMLYDESGIAPEIVAGRGVRTVTRGRDLPQGFSRRQRRRGPGVLFTVHRPSGATSNCFRPNEPDPDEPGRKYELPSKFYGGPGNVLDVHPSCKHLIGRVDVPVIFVEGIKKGDAIVSAARATGVEVLVVAISGVWNWLSDGEPIPDMHEIAVGNRETTICFDSDMLSNPNVQEAVRRLAEHLIEQGARVSIAFLPDKPDGSKQGADDLLAGGATLAELRLLTRRYDPADFERVRLSRDEKLRAGVGYLLRDWRERDWMQFVGAAEHANWQRGHTARDTKEALIELAPRIGNVDERGIVVEAGLRRLAEMSAKTAQSVGTAMKHLEADGQIEILPATDKAKPRRYRLLVPSAALDSMERATHEEESNAEVTKVDPSCKGLRYPSAPRLRWSSPVRSASLVRRVEPATGRTLTEAIGENVFVSPDHRPYAKRLGPHRCAVLDALEAAGGEMHLKELCEALHRKRPWDVRRRIVKPLEEAGIIECEGDVIRLAAEWLTSLDARREEDGEVEQAEKQAKKHRKDREDYRVYLERKKHGTPKASLKAVRRTHELRDRRLRELREEEERDRAPTPPAVEVLIARIMAQHDRMRVGLLCELAVEEGLRRRDVPLAVRRMGYSVERLPEYENEEFVFARRVA